MSNPVALAAFDDGEDNLPAKIDPEQRQLAKLSDEELEIAFREAYIGTADRVRRLALLWCEKERRGHEMEHLRNSMTKYLPGVVAGVVAAEAVAAFMGMPKHLERVARCLPDEQRRLAAGGTVRLQVGLGANDYRTAPVQLLSYHEMLQVFDLDGHIRTQSEQLVRLREKQTLPAPKPVIPRKKGALTVNRETEMLIVGRKAFRPDDVVDALGELTPHVPDESPRTESLTLKFTEAEIATLRERAADRYKGDVRAFVLASLRAIGAI